MSELMKRLKKASTNAMTSSLTESVLFNQKDVIRTRIPILNIALSGELNGGLTSGLTFLAGPSKHFKSNMALCLVSAYMKKYPDAICLFYDSEFGTTPSYFRSMGVDPERILHTPIKNIENLKFDIVNQLEEINREDKVIIFIDSIGNTASKKEVEDALAEKSAADMTRAKQLKSLFRMITPYLTERDIPCVAVNHTYETQEMFSKTVMSGGTGAMYSADTVFIIGRRQVKDGSDVVGYEFVINVDKSRFVKEKSKFAITVTYDGGIDPYSGLIDVGLETGFVVKPKNGWYSRAFLNKQTGELVQEEKCYRLKDTNSVSFWKDLFQHEPFREAIEKAYKLGAIANDAEVASAVEELLSTEVVEMQFDDVDVESQMDKFADEFQMDE